MTSNVGVRIVRVRKRRGLHRVRRSVLLILASLLLFCFAWAVLGLGLTTLVVLLLASLTVLVSLARLRYVDATHSIWAHNASDYGRLRRGAATAHAMRPHSDALRNPEQLSFRLGSVILLIVVFIAFGYSVPAEKYREWAALAETPKPSGCDWATSPLGEKHCHYEPIFHHVNEPSEHITVTWRRVDGNY